MALATRPDLILDYGSLGATYASLADRVQQQTGVPYVLLDGSLSAVPRVYARAVASSWAPPSAPASSARYAERLLAEVDERVARVPADKRPRSTMRAAPAGSRPALRGSINVESLDRLGARNVAAEGAASGGLRSVSIEQVLAWNPEVIVTVDPLRRRGADGSPVAGGERGPPRPGVPGAPGPFPGSTSRPPSIG